MAEKKLVGEVVEILIRIKDEFYQTASEKTHGL